MRALQAAVAIASLTISVGICGETVAAPSPEAFGYRRLVNVGPGTIGQHPLLVIYANFGAPQTSAQMVATTQSYTDTFFSGQKSVSGYFLENSNGRFSWTKAGPGVVWLSFQMNEFDSETDTDKKIRHLNLALTRAASGGFDFSLYDKDSNGRVTAEELTVLVIEGNTGLTNLGAGIRSLEDGYEFTPQGKSVSVSINRAIRIPDYEGFITYCHELTHYLGVDFEMYDNGNSNKNYTTMDATLGDLVSSYHLDPWHKMLFGWVEPRIHSLKQRGTALIDAAQVVNGRNPPIILYDPDRGANEFFIAEFRTAALVGYDANVDSAGTARPPGEAVGVAIWHVKTRGIGGQSLAADLFQFPIAASSTVMTNSVFMNGAPGFTRASGRLWPANSEIKTPLRWMDNNGNIEPQPRGFLQIGALSADGRVISISWRPRVCVATAAACGVMEPISLLLNR